MKSSLYNPLIHMRLTSALNRHMSFAIFAVFLLSLFNPPLAVLLVASGAVGLSVVYQLVCSIVARRRGLAAINVARLGIVGLGMWAFILVF